jgi:hypothetical protein
MILERNPSKPNKHIRKQLLARASAGAIIGTGEPD